MKAKKVIQIETEDYLEGQYILENFPQALWFNYSSNIIFYLPDYLEDEVNEAVKYFENEKEK